MHPDLLRQLGALRDGDMRARADRARLARAAGRAARAARRASRAGHELIIPAIPDYVDGTFAGEAAAGTGTGQVPAARHAA